MRRVRIPLALSLLALWALLIGLDAFEHDEDDIIDILLLIPALGLALWSLFDNADTGRRV